MIAKLLKKDFLATVRRWMERNPAVNPLSKPALFQCVVADCYPGEDYDTLMRVMAETEAAQGIESDIRAHQSDPDHWDFCGVQGALFVGDEAQSPKRYLLPDGRVANRGQVAITYGLELKNKVESGIRKKLDAVLYAITLDQRIIAKAEQHGIDPETVKYAPHEEKSAAADQAA